MDLRSRKQRSKRKKKVITRYQEEKPIVLEATPLDGNNVGLDKDSDIVQIPRAIIKTKKSQIENENATITQSNNEEEKEEDMDISWPNLFASQLLSQVNEQDKITEQEIPMLPNPLHKELLMDCIDIKHLDSETAKHPPISTNVGRSHRPIRSTRLRPSTLESGASSQRGRKKALEKVQSPPIRAQHFNAATHAPLTTPVRAPAPKRLASKHARATKCTKKFSKS